MKTINEMVSEICAFDDAKFAAEMGDEQFNVSGRKAEFRKRELELRAEFIALIVKQIPCNGLEATYGRLLQEILEKHREARFK